MATHLGPRRRILFSARPEHGHLSPVLPLVKAARAAGHEVAVATGESAIPRLCTAGVKTYRSGVSIVDSFAAMAAIASSPAPSKGGRPDLDRGGRVFIDVIARRTVDDLGPLLDRARPDLVVYEQYDIGAGVAAAIAGIPAVCHAVGRAFDAESWRRATGTRLDALWSDYGYASPPVDLAVGDVYLDIYPPSLQVPAARAHPTRVPMRSVAWVEPGASLPRWVTASRSRPLVYLTMGTFPSDSIGVLQTAIDALSTLDVDVLMAAGAHDRLALDPVPESVRVERFVNQAAVLDHVDLVVHHGGSGTMLGALARGIPQLMLPQGADQFTNADVLSDRGLGLALEGDASTASAVATASDALLSDPSYRRASRTVAREMAGMPHPATVLTRLTRLADLAA
jgi:UDP:flavonoid glycosyltransferase YjiC (YdhE family)